MISNFFTFLNVCQLIGSVILSHYKSRNRWVSAVLCNRSNQRQSTTGWTLNLCSTIYCLNNFYKWISIINLPHSNHSFTLGTKMLTGKWKIKLCNYPCFVIRWVSIGIYPYLLIRRYASQKSHKTPQMRILH